MKMLILIILSMRKYIMDSLHPQTIMVVTHSRFCHWICFPKFTFFPLSQSLNCWVLIAATKNGSEHANVKLEEMSRNSAIWRLGKWFEISQRDKLIAHELEWNQSNPIHLTHFAIRSADCSTVSSSTQVSPRLKPTMWITSITMWVLVRHLLVPPLLWQVTKTDMMIFGFWCLIY